MNGLLISQADRPRTRATSSSSSTTTTRPTILCNTFRADNSVLSATLRIDVEVLSFLLDSSISLHGILNLGTCRQGQDLVIVYRQMSMVVGGTL